MIEENILKPLDALVCLVLIKTKIETQPSVRRAKVTGYGLAMVLDSHHVHFIKERSRRRATGTSIRIIESRTPTVTDANAVFLGPHAFAAQRDGRQQTIAMLKIAGFQAGFTASNAKRQIPDSGIVDECSVLNVCSFVLLEGKCGTSFEHGANMHGRGKRPMQ